MVISAEQRGHKPAEDVDRGSGRHDDDDDDDNDDDDDDDDVSDDTFSWTTWTGVCTGCGQVLGKTDDDNDDDDNDDDDDDVDDNVVSDGGFS